MDEGYAIVPACLTSDECDRVVESLSTQTVRRSRAGARHLMTTATIAALARSDRLTQLAREWLGPEAVPFRATLFEKSLSTNWLILWHQDTALPLTKKIRR